MDANDSSGQKVERRSSEEIWQGAQGTFLELDILVAATLDRRDEAGAYHLKGGAQHLETSDALVVAEEMQVKPPEARSRRHVREARDVTLRPTLEALEPQNSNEDETEVDVPET